MEPYALFLRFPQVKFHKMFCVAVQDTRRSGGSGPWSGAAAGLTEGRRCPRGRAAGSRCAPATHQSRPLAVHITDSLSCHQETCRCIRKRERQKQKLSCTAVADVLHAFLRATRSAVAWLEPGVLCSVDRRHYGSSFCERADMVCLVSSGLPLYCKPLETMTTRRPCAAAQGTTASALSRRYFCR